jgi:hypothetical protein
MESYMKDFFTAAKRFLAELKDIILLTILVAALAISGYQFLAWKLTH